MIGSLVNAQPLFKRFTVFTGVGAIGTLVHYLVLLLFVEWLGLWSVAATSVGFLAGAIVNYCLNYKFTFRSNAPHYVALPRFFTIAAVGFFLNATIMKLGLAWLNVNYLVVQLFATALVLVWNFVGNQLWAFRESHRG